MKQKMVIISNCDSCPFFSNEYYSYSEECVELGRKIPRNSDYVHDIPDDCPLEDFEPKEK